jgi:DNA-binding NarL/FixJ family response regulator
MGRKVLLVDDHKIVTQCLSAIIERDTDLEVVGEAGTGREALALVKEHSPDIVIMDVVMPDMNGVEATKQIKKIAPDASVIVLSAYSDKKLVAQMLKAGASGYLLKKTNFEELCSALGKCLDGECCLSPEISCLVVEDYLDRLRREDLSVLTHTEREVLQLIAEGKTNRQISATMKISGKTVEAHRRRIMHKLDIHTVADLTKYAIKEKLTPLDE